MSRNRTLLPLTKELSEEFDKKNNEEEYAPGEKVKAIVKKINGKSNMNISPILRRYLAKYILSYESFPDF